MNWESYKEGEKAILERVKELTAGILKLRQENERLREALESVNTCVIRVSDSPDSVLKEIHHILRKALGETR